MSQKQRIQVIINPAAGQDRPVLAILNSALQAAGVDWDVSVTKQAGDARRYTQEAVQAGVDVVAACGGDGTVVEVASALVGSTVPLAIFPGGTANALALALGIPGDLKEAIALANAPDREVCPIDLAQLDDHYFLVGAGIGIPGAIIDSAGRDAKDRWGPLAYAVGSVQAAFQTETAHYHMTLDGQSIESEGVACAILNASNFGLPGLTLAPNVDIADGLLDVIVFRTADLGALFSLAAHVVLQNETAAPFQHWQAHEIDVVTEPPQPVQADGESLDPGPVHIRVLPQAVRVIIPGPKT